MKVSEYLEMQNALPWLYRCGLIISMDFYGFLLISSASHRLWQMATGNRQHYSDGRTYENRAKSWNPWKSTFRGTREDQLDRSRRDESRGPNESSRGPYLVVVWDKKQKSDTCQPATVRTQFASLQIELQIDSIAWFTQISKRLETLETCNIAYLKRLNALTSWKVEAPEQCIFMFSKY